MEGISNEAASLAGHWGLGKLIAFYDDNHISIDGDTEIAFTENVDQRFEALGWHVIWVKNGNTGYDEIRAAIKEAKAVTDKPTLIKVNRHRTLVSSNNFGIDLTSCLYLNEYAGDYYNWLWISKQGELIQCPWSCSW